jgi:hypothetical protein
MTLKVGMKVRIFREGREFNNTVGFFNDWVNIMDQFVGKTVTIEEISEYGVLIYECGAFRFPPQCFEPIEEEKPKPLPPPKTKRKDMETGNEEEFIVLHCGRELTEEEFDEETSNGEIVFAVDVQEWAEESDCIRFVDTGESAINAVEAHPNYVYIEDTEEYYSDSDNAFNDGNRFVNGPDKWYSGYYVDRNFYYHHREGEWWDIPPHHDTDELDDYSFNPAAEWGFETKKQGVSRKPLPKQLYFGLELEYEMNDEDETSDIVEIAHDLQFAASEDGSLSCGVEFKSKPLCYELVHERVPELLNRVRGSVHADRTCGLHIHLSKAGLTLMQIGLIQDFIYNPDNRDFISKLAGRGPNTYCQRDIDYGKLARIRKVEKSLKYDKDGNPLLDSNGNRIIEYDKDFWGGEKYEALNFCRRETIEFRLFAASMRQHRVLGRVEFVKALTEWTSMTERKTFAEVRDFQQFLTFIKNQGRKRFPNLLKLCYEKELLKEKPKPETKTKTLAA